MYLRFQGKRRNESSPSMLGIFQLAYELRDSGMLADCYEEEFIRCIDWLKMHLKNPAVLQEKENHRAICWFHTRAQKPLKLIRQIKRILEEHGYIIDMVKTRDPGIVIYQDGWQVVAKPRRAIKGANK